MDEVRLQFQALLPAAIRHRPWVDDMFIRQHDLGPRMPLFQPGMRPQRLYFVAKGWLQGATVLSQQLKPISHLRIRGNVIGLAWLDQPNIMEDVSSITPCELISVPSEAFRDWMGRDKLLRDFVFGEIVRDLMNLRMMSAIIGHRKAPIRLAFFLLVMLYRSRHTYQTTLSTLPLPMTQEEIGRLLGLTNVSVNRAFRTLESAGLIQSGRQSVTFKDEEALADYCDLESGDALFGQLVGHRLADMKAA